MSISAYLVGGIKGYALTFVNKAQANGVELEMVGHKDWDSVPRGDVPLCDIVVVLKDVVSHKLRDWARSSCRARGVRFCEVPQKIAVAIEGLRHVLQMEPEESLEQEDSVNKLETYLGDLFITHRTFSEYGDKFSVNPTRIGSRKGAISALQESYVSSMDIISPELKAKLKSPANLERLFDSYREIIRRDQDESLISEVKSVLLSWGISVASVLTKRKSISRLFMMLFGYYPTELDTLLNKPELPLQEEEEIVMPSPQSSIRDTIIEDIHNDPFKVMGYLFSDPQEIHAAQSLSYPLKDFVEVVNEIRGNFVARKRISAQDFSRWQETKYRWAVSLLQENPDINTFGRLRVYSKAIWNSRVSDKYEAILFPQDTPTPIPTPVVSANDHALVHIGSLCISLTRGAEVTIGEITAGEINIEGAARVEIESYSEGTLKGVRITF